MPGCFNLSVEGAHCVLNFVRDYLNQNQIIGECSVVEQASESGFVEGDWADTGVEPLLSCCNPLIRRHLSNRVRVL
jgi:hypothetical protein